MRTLFPSAPRAGALLVLASILTAQPVPEPTPCQGVDVGVLAITSPPDTVDSTMVIQPQAQVRNYGSVDSDSFRCHMQIGGSYHDDELVDNLTPGETRTINFRDWRADTAGRVTAVAWTYLEHDTNPTNDTLRRTFHVRGIGYTDIAALAAGPVGAVRESTVVILHGIAQNVGTTPVGFTAHLAIRVNGPVYRDSVYRWLDPGELDTINTFRLWIADEIGTCTLLFRVNAEGDLNPENDTAMGILRVVEEMHDVGVMEILSPTGRIGSGPVTPQARVRNPGDYQEAFWTRFWIYRGAQLYYRDSVWTDPLDPSSDTTLSFPPWLAIPGSYTARCSTRLAGDEQNANDFKAVEFTVDSIQHVSERASHDSPDRLLRAWPSPAGGWVTLRLPGRGPIRWRLYDAVGNALREGSGQGGAAGRVDLGSLVPGVYFLHAQDQTARLVIE